jgi:hypothetical protein
MALRISVWTSKELQAVIRSMKGLDRETAKVIRRETKAVVGPIWREAVGANVTNALEARVLANTARVAVTDQNVTLQSARIGKALSGGGKPAQLAAATEFGSAKYKQFGKRRKAGPVYNAAAEVIPRIASLWVQTVVRGLHDAFDGK